MVASPAHITLVANTVATITFDRDFERIEVCNVDGVAAIYFRFGATAPTVEGAGCHVLPAAVGSLEVPVHTSGPTVVKLISSGTPKVSAREAG